MIPGAGPQWPGPVSYTHLDVYKRQGCAPVRARFRPPRRRRAR
ncbi:hypothetical protein [Burkholderia plantarii]|nr:hypothetical protein [Burkholderia plantarii]